MLHPVEDVPKLADPGDSRTVFAARYTRDPDEGIQLIHGAVSLDAQGIFRDSLTSRQGRLTFITTFGVNPIQRNSRVVERPFFRHAFILTNGFGLTNGFEVAALGWGILNSVSPLSWIIL